MKTASNISIVAVMGIALACTHINESNQEEKLFLGEKISFENLHLYSVLANEAFLSHRRTMGAYLSLKEAINQNKVVVTEHVSQTLPSTPNEDEAENIQEGPSVNTLFIENTSSDTVFILNGEMIEGGNQDRVIAQDMIVQPHSGKIDVSVFCVEKNRWDDSDQVFYIAEESLTPGKVRKAAVQDKDQEAVWSEVSQKIEQLEVSSPTLALADVKLGNNYQDRITSYQDQLKNIFKNKKNIVGVIAISGSEIIGCDLFATNMLFNKHYSNLLQSYATDALTGSNKTNITVEMVDDYLLRVIEEKAKPEGFIRSKDKPYHGKNKTHISTF